MLRSLAWRVVPQVMAERSARYQRSLRAEWGMPAQADEFIAAHGDRVLRGPFRGMRYWRGGDAPIAKLVGSYEIEIAPWFAEAISEPPSVFVDLGAADGYYAVGMRIACPSTQVVAFELSSTARRELKRLAALNEAEIVVRGRASSRALTAMGLSGALVLCDIEGAEGQVLELEPLRDSTVIVELHDHVQPGVTDLLCNRFQASHTVEIVHSTGRSSHDFPEVASDEVLDEHRGGPMSWARFVPHSRR